MPATDGFGLAIGGLVKAQAHANAGAFHRYAMSDLLPIENMIGCVNRFLRAPAL